MHLIVAAAINGKFEVWKTCSSVLSPIDDAKPTLMGFTSQLYQHVANKLHATELPVNQTMLVGLRILELAGQSCTCVDRPYSAVLVHGGPFVEFDDALLAELTQSVTVFGAALDRLLLACADTSLTTREFMRTFREFRTTAHQLRKDYLQTVGEIDFRKRKETAGFGYGISFTPSGTLIAGIRDPATGKINLEIKEDQKTVKEMVRRSLEVHHGLMKKKG